MVMGANGGRRVDVNERHKITWSIGLWENSIQNDIRVFVITARMPYVCMRLRLFLYQSVRTVALERRFFFSSLVRHASLLCAMRNRTTSGDGCGEEVAIYNQMNNKPSATRSVFDSAEENGDEHRHRSQIVSEWMILYKTIRIWFLPFIPYILLRFHISRIARELCVCARARARVI